MESFLDLVARGLVDPGPLVTHRFDSPSAEHAFELLTGDGPRGPADRDRARLRATRRRRRAARRPAEAAAAGRRWSAPRGAAAPQPRFGLIGAGRFATATIIPGLVGGGFEAGRGRLGRRPLGRGPAAALRLRPAALGPGGADRARRPRPGRDRHPPRLPRGARRAALARRDRGLRREAAGARREGLAAVRDAQAATGAPLVVGFNRRYAPIAAELRKLPGPAADGLPGQRRAGSRPTTGPTTRPRRRPPARRGLPLRRLPLRPGPGDPLRVTARGFRSDPACRSVATDNFTLQIDFADGSAGTLNYAADAPTGPGKERFETSSPGVYGVLDDFRSGEIWRGSRTRSAAAADKGWSAQYELLAAVVAGRRGAAGRGLLLSTLATLAAARSLSSGVPETVVEPAAAPATVRRAERRVERVELAGSLQRPQRRPPALPLRLDPAEHVPGLPVRRLGSRSPRGPRRPPSSSRPMRSWTRACCISGVAAYGWRSPRRLGLLERGRRGRRRGSPPGCRRRAGRSPSGPRCTEIARARRRRLRAPPSRRRPRADGARRLPPPARRSTAATNRKAIGTTASSQSQSTAGGDREGGLRRSPPRARRGARRRSSAGRRRRRSRRGRSRRSAPGRRSRARRTLSAKSEWASRTNPLSISRFCAQ